MAGVCLLIFIVPACSDNNSTDAQRAVADKESGSVAPSDYLTLELRDKVERLKAAVANTAASSATVQDRARTLFLWGNAYALKRGPIPVDLPYFVSAALGADAKVGPAERINRQIDFMVRELSLLDEDPSAVGTLAVDFLEGGEIKAGGYASFSQVYTAGNRGVQRGGGLLIARHAISRYASNQTKDPQAANYISVTSSNPAVSFQEDSYPYAGQHGGFRAAIPLRVFRVAGADLAPGDTVTVTYGDRSGGSPGYLMQTFSNDRAAFPLYVDLDGSSDFFSLPIQAIPVAGTDIAGLHGFAPSVVGIAETFTLSVRAQDMYGNKASGEIPATRIFVNGEVVRELPAGRSAVTLVEDMLFNTPEFFVSPWKVTILAERLTLSSLKSHRAIEFSGVTRMAIPDLPRVWERLTGSCGLRVMKHAWTM